MGETNGGAEPSGRFNPDATRIYIVIDRGYIAWFRRDAPDFHSGGVPVFGEYARLRLEGSSVTVNGEPTMVVGFSVQLDCVGASGTIERKGWTVAIPDLGPRGKRERALAAIADLRLGLDVGAELARSAAAKHGDDKDAQA